MTTVRRVYLYLASFIGLSVTLAGVFVLIGLMVDQGFDAFRGFLIGPSSQGLALVIAGAVTWRFFWRTAQREANVAADERASGMRKLYVYGTLAISLLAALILIQQELSTTLVRLVNGELNGYKPWTSLLIAAVLLLIWRWHDWIALQDKAANGDGVRGADLRRGYWLAVTSFGALNAASGLAALISGVLTLLGGQPAFGSDWAQALLPPVVQLAVSACVLWLFWFPSQKAAEAGDDVERTARTRVLLIHLVVFLATVWVLNGARNLLEDVLNRLLSGFSSGLLVLTLNRPLAELTTGGLLLWYFFRRVRATLLTPRLSEYLIAGVAFFIAVLGIQLLVAALFQILGGQGSRIETLIANLAPPLLVGGAVWRQRWQKLEAEVSSPEDAPARAYLWRKVYLYFYQLVGLVLNLSGAVSVLQALIATLLGQPAGAAGGGNVLAALSIPLSFLLVGSGLMIYMLQLTASDSRLGGLSVEDTLRQTLGDGLPTWAIAAAVGVFVLPLLFLAAFGVFASVASSTLGGFNP